MPFPNYVGDYECDGGVYATEECGWDGGDCITFWSRHPLCNVDQPFRVGNGICDFEFYNYECGWDGDDCIGFLLLYPECIVDNTNWVGDGICDGAYNIKECNYDGGDCDR